MRSAKNLHKMEVGRSEPDRPIYFPPPVIRYPGSNTPAVGRILSPATGYQARLRLLAALTRKCGCNHPNEQTKALIVAIAFHNAGDADIFALNGRIGYDAFVLYKNLFLKTPTILKSEGYY